MSDKKESINSSVKESEISAGATSDECSVLANRNAGKQPIFFEGGVMQINPTSDVMTEEVREKVIQVTQFYKEYFPGSQPVSLSRENLPLLKSEPYLASWKADGVRYLLFIDEYGEVYFIDRNFNVFIAPTLEFKYKDSTEDLTNTLVDGEMVMNKDPETGERQPEYLIFDAMLIGGLLVTEEPFKLRWEKIFTDIIHPRNTAMRFGEIYDGAQPCNVSRKNFWNLNRTSVSRLLSDEFKKSVHHDTDGLMFQPVNQLYTPGLCKTTLKWKPHHLNSIDFSAKLIPKEGTNESAHTCELYVGSSEKPFSVIEDVVDADLLRMDGKIIECVYDSDKQQFRMMRERTDKTFPNSHKTATSVLKTMKDPIDEASLLDYLEANPCEENKEFVTPPFVANFF